MLTDVQLFVLEELASKYPVVLADVAEEGAVLFTPAEFCKRCHGEGVDPPSWERHKLTDCPRCKGKGGTAVTLTPVLVHADGPEAYSG